MRITRIDTYRTGLQPNVCIVRLTASDGSVGFGESFWGASAVEAYIHDTAAAVVAETDGIAPADLARRLRPYVGFSGSGAEVRGNGALDIALWDLLGRQAGMPVVNLLGGPIADRIRVYNTCAGSGYISKHDRQASTNWGLAPGAERALYEDLDGFLHHPADLAHSLAEEGYTALKVWPFDRAAEANRGHDISTADLREAMSILEAIRTAEPTLDLLVELHSLWSLKAATKLLHALADVEPFWVEDPIRGDGVDAYLRLRDRVTVPIAAGEALTGTRAFKPLLDAGALDVAIVDTGWTGGVTEAVRVATLADTYGVSYAPHDCTGPLSFAVCCHLVASQPNGLIGETVRAFHAGWYSEVFDGLPTVKDGLVEIPAVPGFGVNLRPDFLTRSDTRIRTTRHAQA